MRSIVSQKSRPGHNYRGFIGLVIYNVKTTRKYPKLYSREKLIEEALTENRGKEGKTQSMAVRDEIKERNKSTQSLDQAVETNVEESQVPKEAVILYRGLRSVLKPKEFVFINHFLGFRSFYIIYRYYRCLGCFSYLP